MDDVLEDIERAKQAIVEIQQSTVYSDEEKVEKTAFQQKWIEIWEAEIEDYKKIVSQQQP